MDRRSLSELKKHPKYEAIISDVLSNNIDASVMAEAVKLTKNKAQAEAVYVMFKLRQSDI